MIYGLSIAQYVVMIIRKKLSIICNSILLFPYQICQKIFFSENLITYFPQITYFSIVYTNKYYPIVR